MNFEGTRKRIHQLRPRVSHSKRNRLSSSSLRDAWNAERENGMELSFGRPPAFTVVPDARRDELGPVEKKSPIRATFFGFEGSALLEISCAFRFAAILAREGSKSSR